MKKPQEGIRMSRMTTLKSFLMRMQKKKKEKRNFKILKMAIKM